MMLLSQLLVHDSLLLLLLQEGTQSLLAGAAGASQSLQWI